MQLTNIILSTLLAQLVAAAPVAVMVTETVWVTVDAGETQALTDAYIPSPTESIADAQITTSANGLLVELNTTPAATEDAVSTQEASTEAPTATAQAATTTSAATAPSPTTLETSTVESSSSTSTTSAASTATSAASDGSFQSEILNEHNAKRALHGVAALTWDDTLATYAQNYADQYDCSGTLTHSGGQYGENLALGYTTTGAVDAWYAEGDNFDYSACNVYDHFTQVVWKSTTKVGCAYKTCDSYWGTYIICSYDPAGNFVSECSDNVLPLV